MRSANGLEVAESRPKTAATVARIRIMQCCGCGMSSGRSTCPTRIPPIGPLAGNPHRMDTLTAKPPAGAKPQDGLPPEQRRWAVAAIFAALAMGSLDTVIANIALPAMAADLHVSPAEIVWVINVYQII